MANNVNWGWVDTKANIMVPGMTAGDGRCEAGQFGVIAEDTIAYSNLENLRSWLRSALDQLPPSRDLVTVDLARQWRWLDTLKPLRRDDWTPTVDNVQKLCRKVFTDPYAAGWTLGLGVSKLRADRDEDQPDDLMVSIKLHGGRWIGIGDPLTDSDLQVRLKCSTQEAAHAVLNVVAQRINKAY